MTPSEPPSFEPPPWADRIDEGVDDDLRGDVEAPTVPDFQRDVPADAAPPAPREFDAADGPTIPAFGDEVPAIPDTPERPSVETPDAEAAAFLRADDGGERVTPITDVVAERFRGDGEDDGGDGRRGLVQRTVDAIRPSEGSGTVRVSHDAIDDQWVVDRRTFGGPKIRRDFETKEAALDYAEQQFDRNRAFDALLVRDEDGAIDLSETQDPTDKLEALIDNSDVEY